MILRHLLLKFIRWDTVCKIIRTDILYSLVCLEYCQTGRSWLISSMEYCLPCIKNMQISRRKWSALFLLPLYVVFILGQDYFISFDGGFCKDRYATVIHEWEVSFVLFHLPLLVFLPLLYRERHLVLFSIHLMESIQNLLCMTFFVS